MEQLINVEDLHKSYGSKVVLDGVSFSAAPGQIIGLLGPNGCGKTTLIKVLTGLIKDHTGTVRINNEEPGAYTKSIVAYLPEKSYLPDWMRPIDAINYFTDFYQDFDKDKALLMVSRFGLDLKQRVKTMSKGQQEKLRLLLVICRNAQLFILDEPLGGVDPAARAKILDLILENRAASSTVLISTHLIADVENVLDEAVFLKEGKVVLHQAADEIREEKGASVDKLFREVFKC